MAPFHAIIILFKRAIRDRVTTVDYCYSDQQQLQEEKGSTSSFPSHRVTFNDKNEVASQDLDGSFTVTYSQLGERISQRKTGGQSQGLRVQFGERSNLERTVLPSLAKQSLYRDIYSEESTK